MVCRSSSKAHANAYTSTDFARLPDEGQVWAHQLAGSTEGLATQPIIPAMMGFISKTLLHHFGPRFYYGYGDGDVLIAAHNLSNTLGGEHQCVSPTEKL